MQKPSIPKGTRDFGPAEMQRRNYIFDTIRSVFRLYGYQPIETPAMENLSTLLGKYGEEGDKLLFRILNSGDFLKDVPPTILQQPSAIQLLPHITEKGLRYDLTVPFARFVVQHRDQITLPFRRYQIQPVWRADRPQKGRYREFYQCDADVIGSTSLFNEAELISMIDEVFARLNLKVRVLLNNRKILAGIAEYIGHPEMLIDITTAIDKLDKIGLEKVNQELSERGLPSEAIEKLQPVLFTGGKNEEKIQVLTELLKESPVGLKGLEELQNVLNYLPHFGVQCEVIFDLTLARGLNYYTGAIIEVKSLDVSMGSICGGGRYDDLTGIFGLPGISGVGISFGADRIYDVLEQTERFPAEATSGTRVLILNFGEKEEQYCLPLLLKLRREGISAELYPDASKIKKQMAHADAYGIPYVVLAGEDEINAGMFTLKNMQTGEQQKLTAEELVKIVAE
ncbi:MAG: histidine--tRNA ligase [Bacteroidales bacterium]|jgi:histidyl-tRNA synthetase|nr:histidine--tRNA ligase [Bacteroidales bacterium]NPV35490.1 histidine--tRNA ligase [Bacteroidales bacterium]